ncbi:MULTISPECIES: hypothetical protein [Okeania]|uniref:hypothetical protein n=1 Tax=Okeania TaxID=1458928 RepID=UPI001374DF5D|nr:MULTISPECIES: hypothetical protein [Okeania]NEP04502.1 hypothetical protein [Okeania sp. SIO4D6]NEP44602.1 hypothetical protein [Okeania sp. SIO2H7]NEP71627.1 hypothetical protein [Okeania sp. SIO2G5]NEP86221.1 hypothetical protein [Okeania sp. SIO2C2]NEP91722.1 hypothetical protein [Okeania sp. SIO2F5]
MLISIRELGTNTKRDKCLLQITKLFIRSQESGVRSQEGRKKKEEEELELKEKVFL